MDKDIDIDLIEPDHRSRSVLREIKLLPQEIAEAKERGIVRPVIVRPVKNAAGKTRYIIVATARSWLLAQAVGLSKVPARIRDDDSPAIDEPALEIANPLQWARQAMSELRFAPQGDRRCRGITRYAKKMGVAAGTAKNWMRLLSLARPVQRLFEEGRLCQGAAKALASLPPEAQARIAQQVVRKKLNVRVVEELVQIERGNRTVSNTGKPAVSHQKNTAVRSTSTVSVLPKDPDTIHLEGMLTEALGSRSVIEQGALIIECGANAGVVSGLLEKLDVARLGCRATIDGHKLTVEYGGDPDRLDKLLQQIGVTN